MDAERLVMVDRPPVSALPSTTTAFCGGGSELLRASVFNVTVSEPGGCVDVGISSAGGGGTGELRTTAPPVTTPSILSPTLPRCW